MLCALAALAAATGGAAPTGIRFVDLTYTAALGAAVPAAGSRSRRWTWLASALATVWVAPNLTGRLVAGLGVVLAVWALATIRRRWVGALVGLVVVTVLARLGTGPFHASTSLAAVAAASPMLWSAARRLRPGRSRAFAASAAMLAAAALLATLVFGLVSVLALDDVTGAIDDARTGFEAAGDGEQELAAASFDDSRDGFDRARRLVGGPWSLPARLVPVVGQHARAVQVAAAEGASLADTAAVTARSVDLDEVRLESAQIDLDLLDELAPVLARAERAVVGTRDRIRDVENPWLIPPIASRLAELADELDDAVPAARTASLAVRELPTMLGRDRTARWLVLFTSPAEARGLGGLVGNYALVEADDGQVAITSVGRNEDLNRALESVGATLRGPAQYATRWGRYEPERHFQDVTLSPDLPLVAAVAADLVEQATTLRVDGVVVVDPDALAAILDLTGPVQAGPLRLGDSNVVPFLLTEQYVLFADDEDERVRTLSELVINTFDAFTAGGLPGPRGLAAELGALIDQGRIGYWWADGAGPAALAADVGLDGGFPEADGGDLFAVVHQNAGQNKVDVYLQRTVTYDVTLGDDGDVQADVVIDFANAAPTSGLPDAIIGSNDQGLPPGTNRALVHLHTALDVVSVRVDGADTPVTRERAFDHEAAGFTIDIPSGATVRVEASLRSRLGPAAYRLTLPHQPLVNDDLVSVTVTRDGVREVLLDQVRLTEDLVLSLPPD